MGPVQLTALVPAGAGPAGTEPAGTGSAGTGSASTGSSGARPAGDDDAGLAGRVLARPDVSATVAFRRAFHGQVRDRFRIDVARAARLLPQPAGAARGALAALDPARRWRPEVFLRRHQVARALSAGDLVGVRGGLDGLVSLAAEGLYRDGCQWGRVTGDAIDVEAAALLTGVSPQRTELRPPGAVAASRATRWLLEAAGMLVEVDPAMAAECDVLVAQLRYHADAGPDAFTSARWFGRLYLRLPAAGSAAEPVLHLLDHLTHEASHLSLHVRMAVDPLLTNGTSGGFAAPIRPDPRPLGGVFHAMFVLGRVARVMARLAARDARPAVRHAADTQRALFEHGYRTVVDHAALTPVGRRVVTDCRAMVDEAAG